MSKTMVVKVGGSLYDMPDLAERLRALIATLETERVLLFPGGGATVDALRLCDRVHDLGDEASHWLALRCLTVNAYFLQSLLPEFTVALWPELADRAIVEPYSFALADERNPRHLPHRWDITSDTLAARTAELLGANLLLLKSVDIASGLSWERAAQQGIVDTFLPGFMAKTPGLRGEMLNLRSWSRNDEPSVR